MSSAWSTTTSSSKRNVWSSLVSLGVMVKGSCGGGEARGKGRAGGREQITLRGSYIRPTAPAHVRRSQQNR